MVLVTVLLFTYCGLDNDDVYCLLQYKNPWGTNKSLLNLYQGATEDNECPVVVDTST